MRVTIEKKTDQLNYEDFLHGITRIVTIVEVRRGTKEQQYDIVIAEDDRVWRPAVTVLKQLVEAWGDNAAEWVGRRAELYGDPDVMFGREKVGGIRVSRLSHITRPVTASLTVTRGKRGTFTVDPLPDAAPAAPAKDWDAVLATALGLTDTAALGELWTREQVGTTAPAHIKDAIYARGEAIKAGAEVSPEDAFPEGGAGE